ncbi:hypothetical protein [Rhizobium sp. WW_1]|uniref:hypothetical protein n=1 Tax=Rhizobium sp. WW_1 TaxID=1907375 RepID=UPI00064727AE|nr:hypothetical protein [Rhizobium sp. WW_1]RKD61570.1 hypothetical protein BJ928_107171 [Rhizobium sp. WW_1]
MFNTNLVHNILNLFGLVLGALLTVDWSGLGMSDVTAAKVAASVLLLSNVIKVTINLTRDGAKGILQPQPPVAANDSRAAADTKAAA